jgi:glycosyltransferase involved in cell wall biosynthesis
MILSKGAYGFYLKNKNFHFQYNLKNKKDAMKFFIFYNSSFFNQIQHSYIKDTISQFKFDTLERIKRNPSFFNSIKKFKLISILGRVLFYSYPFPSDSRTVRLKPLCIIGYPKGDFGVAQNLRGLASALNTNINFDIFDLGTSGLHSELDSSCKNITSSINSNFLIFCVNADSTREAIKRTQTNDNQFYKVGYWFWELSTFPDVWKVAADSLDEIWAPTEFILNALKKFTTKPILHIPVVVEPKITRKYMRSEFNLPDGVFLFLFSYDFHSYQQRKNPDAVIEAFIKAFPRAQKNVGLVIKTINSEKYPESLLSLNKLLDRDSRIHLINKNLSRDQMYGLITVCDSYVSLHRAEGFGLGLAEAMFFGKPVIGTAYSGNLDFMNLDNSCMVNYKLINVKSGEYPYFEGQKWADPDTSHAAYFMKLLVGDKKFYKTISKNGQKFIKERHNSKTISKILSQRLDFKKSSQVI